MVGRVEVPVRGPGVPGRTRTLVYQTWGDEHAHPVFLLHGTPGSRLGPRPRTFDLHKLGVRLIAYDRPGYGDSDRDPGRTVADAAADVDAIARRLGLERYSVVGRSGGGPHALATAAINPGGRVASAAALVSTAPPDADGAELDWFEDMSPSNVATYRLLDRCAPDVTELGSLLARNAEAIRSDPASLLRSLDEELPAVDRVVVTDAGVRRMLLVNYLSAVGHARSPGAGPARMDPRAPLGWVDDLVAFRTPWEFKLAEIDPALPVLLWHGEHDVFAPLSHFRYLERHIPSARAVLQPSVAHFAALPAMPQVLAWVRDRAREVRSGTAPVPGR
ncbi:alpha/beta fold hydrolase [Streptomyces griseoaurantiacus]|uniref:alpha/beta fold hydrolase n=1 Tax=Streptomyces griseoaurantiacus TaxID=68213 RepID=UPI0037AB51B1